MSIAKIPKLKEYLNGIEKDIIRLDEINEIWEYPVIPYIMSRFKLQEKTVKRILSDMIPSYIIYSVPVNIYVDAKAWELYQEFDPQIEGIGWSRIINTIEGYDYCQYYYGQWFFSEIDVPDYYDDETQYFIWEQLESLLSEKNFWLEFGENGTDLYICHNYEPDMFVEYLEIVKDDNIIQTWDQLYIQQICQDNME